MVTIVTFRKDASERLIAFVPSMRARLSGCRERSGGEFTLKYLSNVSTE
jgi:hypothetical protein